ncbi:DUF4870 domain-containing protein [Gryllotalpicola ginsengisoli]|uniref:DUF4870 domain-containing protein n=1 Tax=Gryllotalpicola ginsengisoli TaxID=444608 RepID=UPI0003B51325|nr:DUF4870 domain-containing protein [Gryllotalpicola ginsengisoli]
MSYTPPPAGGSPYSSPQPPLDPMAERSTSTVFHVLGIFFSWISALIGYLMYKDRGPFVRQHLTTELNFQLTIVAAYIAATILTVVTIGLLGILFIVPPIFQVIFGIIAAVRANEGAFYEIPVAIKFVK